MGVSRDQLKTDLVQYIENHVTDPLTLILVLQIKHLECLSQVNNWYDDDYAVSYWEPNERIVEKFYTKDFKILDLNKFNQIANYVHFDINSEVNDDPIITDCRSSRSDPVADQ